MLTGNNNKVLLATVVLSIVVHAGGLYLLWPVSTEKNWVKPGQIEVKVIASSSKKSGSPKTKGTKTHQQPETLNNADRVLPEPGKDADPASQSNHHIARAPSKLTIQLRGKIKTALQKHLTYPPIARRRGWQGTVTIHVTIRGNGDLHQVKLGKSSGYSLLDKSAIAAMQKVGRLTELKPLLQGKSFPIELPIRYLLEDPDYGAPTV